MKTAFQSENRTAAERPGLDGGSAQLPSHPPPVHAAGLTSPPASGVGAGPGVSSEIDPAPLPNTVLALTHAPSTYSSFLNRYRFRASIARTI
jgi:hypothetical protein